MLHEEVKAPRTLRLLYITLDDHGRPVYRTSDDRLYVDIDHRAWRPAAIATKYRNEFYGEPDQPISPDLEIEFVPRRQVCQLIGPLPLA